MNYKNVKAIFHFSPQLFETLIPERLGYVMMHVIATVVPEIWPP
jgi:hypothetical protein